MIKTRKSQLYFILLIFKGIADQAAKTNKKRANNGMPLCL